MSLMTYISDKRKETRWNYGWIYHWSGSLNTICDLLTNSLITSKFILGVFTNTFSFVLRVEILYFYQSKIFVLI